MKKKILLILLSIITRLACAQLNSNVVYLTSDSLTYLLDENWKYSSYDSPLFAGKDYNDKNWRKLNEKINYLDNEAYPLNGIGWFRIQIHVDSTITNKTLALCTTQFGASEIYFDGKLFEKYGKIKSKDSTEYYDPLFEPKSLIINDTGLHIIAVRYVNYELNKRDFLCFIMQIGIMDNVVLQKIFNLEANMLLSVSLTAIFFILALIHLFLYIFYKTNASNLYFSIFMFCVATLFFILYIFTSSNNVLLKYFFIEITTYISCLACISFAWFLHILFHKQSKIIVYIILAICFITICYHAFLHSDYCAYLITVLIFITAVYSVYKMIHAIYKKIEGAKIIGLGFGFFVISILSIIILLLIKGDMELNTSNSVLGTILLIILIIDLLSIPLTMSIYQAWVFAKLNKGLIKQLHQIQELSSITIQQEQEKKIILKNQNAILETKVEERTYQLKQEKKKSDDLLLNILPEEIAEELKQKGIAEAKQYNHVTVLFTDFVNFTGISEQLSPKDLVAEIHKNFTAFDAIIERNGLEKIKTIGDAYLAVCGLPNEDTQHAKKVLLAAIEICEYTKNSNGIFNIRIGINTGPVVAGIVGVKKYAYDIWGDTVNTAARMEQNSEAGKINISGATYQLIKNDFTCTHRGKIEAKNKGEIDMYFVN